MASLPPSITNASREQLQQFLLDTLKKLKSRDKRLEELQAAASASAAEVEGLQARLVSSSRESQARLDAEVELLASQHARELKEASATAQDLVAQLAARERRAAQLEGELEGAEARCEAAEQAAAESAAQHAQVLEQAVLEKEAAEAAAARLQARLAEVETAASEAQAPRAQDGKPGTLPSDAPGPEARASPAPDPQLLEKIDLLTSTVSELEQRQAELRTENARLLQTEEQTSAELLTRLAAVSSANRQSFEALGEKEGLLVRSNLLCCGRIKMVGGGWSDSL